MNKQAYKRTLVVGLRSNPKLGYKVELPAYNIIEWWCGLGCKCKSGSSYNGPADKAAVSEKLYKDMIRRHNKKQIEFSKRIREGDTGLTDNQPRVSESFRRIRWAFPLDNTPVITRQDPLSGREVPEVRLDPTP